VGVYGVEAFWSQPRHYQPEEPRQNEDNRDPSDRPTVRKGTAPIFRCPPPLLPVDQAGKAVMRRWCLLRHQQGKDGGRGMQRPPLLFAGGVLPSWQTLTLPKQSREPGGGSATGRPQGEARNSFYYLIQYTERNKVGGIGGSIEGCLCAKKRAPRHGGPQFHLIPVRS